MVCVHWNFVDRILKTLGGGLMEKFDSQPRWSMLSTINSFKSIKSNHEYQILKYFSATLSQSSSSKWDGIIKIRWNIKIK